jgi:protein gp37
LNPTSIAWVVGPDGKPGYTWNPGVGCSPVSAGCMNCWAARLASTRLAHLPEYQGLAKDGNWLSGARFLERRLGEPHSKRKPTGIAVSLMGDLWHDGIPDAFIQEVFRTMGACSWHRFYLLTKRPNRQREFLASVSGEGWPLPNVFVGVSIEDQPTADARIPELLQTPAAFRFVSYEPALGPVDLTSVPWPNKGRHRLDWVIAGGESGPGARRCHVNWLRNIARQCRGAHVPCFIKQLGSNCHARNDENFTSCEGDPEFPKWPDHLAAEDRIEDLPNGHYQGAPVRVRLRDRAGADPSEWPEDLRVRQLPEVSP